MLKSASLISSKAIMVTGSGTSTAGLTVAAVRVLLYTPIITFYLILGFYGLALGSWCSSPGGSWSMLH